MAKHLSREQMILKVREAAEPAAESFGLSLWGVEIVEGGRMTVRIYVDSPVGEKSGNGEDGILEGVGIDQCADISRMVGLAMDVEEVFPNAWVLEVSSPGFDRTFFAPEQLKGYVGRDVDISLVDPHPLVAGRRKFKGPLKAVEGDTLTVEVPIPRSEGEKPEPTDVDIRWNMVKKARLIHIFPEIVKPGSGKNAQRNSGKGGGKNA